MLTIREQLLEVLGRMVEVEAEDPAAVCSGRERCCDDLGRFPQLILTSSCCLKLGNAWVYVQLIHRPNEDLKSAVKKSKYFLT